MEQNSTVALEVLVMVTRTRLDETGESVKLNSPSPPPADNRKARRTTTAAAMRQRILVRRVMLWPRALAESRGCVWFPAQSNPLSVKTNVGGPLLASRLRTT